ncbi:hypothetical protein CEXT_124961 [Caerostris extrusa]|uniref:Uncharacterized protein n=1 Tax=Caerostris extrusa TaxID=172846 RepID=A0AAV4U4F7_CAEEX|nr:hypothetical protein CEXT_124961 [Caerostris extrusa]
MQQYKRPTSDTPAKNDSKRLKLTANKNDFNLPSTSSWKPSTPEGRISSSTPQSKTNPTKLNLPNISKISLAMEEVDLDSD